jgi:competence protein ComEC
MVRVSSRTSRHDESSGGFLYLNSATLKSVSSFYFYTGIFGFLGGVATTSLYEVHFIYLVYLVMMAGVVWVMSRRGSRASSSGHLTLVSLFLIAAVLGIVRFDLASMGEVNDVYESLVDTEVALEGIVIREPDVREKITHLYVRVDDEVLLVKASRYTDIVYGDRITFEGVLKKPESFETDLGRTFKYPEYLHARGVSYTVSFAKVDVLEAEQGNIFISNILAGKQLFMRNIEYVIPEPQVGLAEGLLLGVKQALGDELETVFRKTGIIHIVVLSGYNVMLVVIFITYVLSYVLPFRARVWFGIGAIVCFAILVGLSATVVRASIMASLVLFAQATGRLYAVLRALVLAGLIMILLNPYLLIYDVGFQLSFLATLGLVFFAPYVEKWVTFMPRLFKMREFLTATIATQLFVMPILLYSIGEFSLVSVVVNVLVLPMVPVAMLLTFITGMVGFISVPVATLLGFVTYISLEYILVIASFFAGVPFASVAVQAFPFWVVIVSYVLMGYILYRLNNPSNKEVSISAVTYEANEVEEWVLEEEDVVEKRLEAESRSDSASRILPTFYQ